MNKSVIDGLNRRLQNIEKFKYINNFYKLLRDYFSFISKNPYVSNITQRIIEEDKIPEDFILLMIFLSMEMEDKSFLPNSFSEKVNNLYKEIDEEYEDRTKNLIVEEIEIIRQENIKRSIKEIINEITKEQLLANLSIFNNLIIDELNNEISEIDVIKKSKLNSNNLLKNEISIGPLSYKNGLIYYNESLIERLDPQMRKLCYLFFIRKNEFLSYKTIQDELSDSEYVTKENMQKVVSKVRTILKSKIKKNLINNVNGKGYIFNSKIIT
jgi:DNA-binding winged helix-turn-helix (wHTH) protein